MNMTGAFVGVVVGRLLHRGLDDLMVRCSYGLAAGFRLAVDVTKPLVPRAQGT